MQKVFITGASGFIGGYVLREFLEHGWEVHTLIHRTQTPELTRLKNEGIVKTYSGSVSDLTSLKNIFKKCSVPPFDTVVHCAGRASDIGARKIFKSSNFDSVKHLARLSLETGARRFVFVSSTDVYGMRDFMGEAEDELPLEVHPANPYPEFKIDAEKWLTSELPSNRYAIVRPAAVWGKGDLTITKRVVDFLRVSPWIVHFGHWKGENRWPLAHVRNVAAAIYLASSEPGFAGQAMNVLDSERVSIDEFYRMMARTFFPSKSFRTFTIPYIFASPVAKLITLISNQLNLTKPITDPSHYALLSVSSNLDFSNQRFMDLMKAAGRAPVSLAEGLAELQEV